MKPHKMSFSLTVYSSDPNMSDEEFKDLVAQKLFQIEQELNFTGRLRFHIQEGRDATATS